MQFILTVTEHHTLGHLLLPYLVEKVNDRPYLTVSHRLRTYDLSNGEYQFSQLEHRIIKLTERYSDEYLAKKFNKKGTLNDFYRNIRAAEYTQKIIPFLEETMDKCLDLIKGTEIQVYYKKARYTNLYEEDRVVLCYKDIDIIFNFERLTDETHYFLTIRHGDEQLSLLHKNIILLVNEPCRILYQNKLYFFDNISGNKLLPFIAKEFITIPRKMEDKYYETFVFNSIKTQRVTSSGFEIIDADLKQQAILFLESDLKGFPVFVLSFRYNSEQINYWDESKRLVHLLKNHDNYTFYRYERNKRWENNVIHVLENLGLYVENNGLKLRSQNASDPLESFYETIEWVSRNKNHLEKEHVEYSLENLSQKYYIGTCRLDLKISHSNDWFDLHAIVQIDNFQIPFIRFKKNILNGKREYKLPNGEIVILPREWFTFYREVFNFGKPEDSNIRLHNYHFTLVESIMDDSDAEIKEKIRKYKEQRFENQEIPLGFKANLRQYQIEGYNWLHSLYSNHLGGCLADDMGLGKTLQALTLLLKLKKPENNEFFFPRNKDGQLSLFNDENTLPENFQPASLIVLPVSLVHNWEKEITKFTPDLRYFVYTGTRRERNLSDILYNYDLILTTYGTARMDADVLSNHDFFFLILDESQNIKNAESKTYQAIIRFRSQFRLVLTGTPVENSLSDLWSQLNFLNRGLLGSFNFFKQNFIIPIENNKDTLAADKLHAIIQPFILRRKKEQVASDLPPLTEQSFTVEMTKEQRDLYEAEKSSVRNLFLSDINEKGLNKSKFIVLQALTRLRQIAIHPGLINPESQIESGKFNEILSMLSILVNENHKILVFSSFVKHLNLLIREFQREKWNYSILTGQTTDRKSIIEEFQSDPQKNIFLISLKAGGVGLNLTAADYIFIVDPWWNPAVEMQAISRAHRIGQDKKVFVYRFISENTVEEKIQKLQEKKSALAEEFINANDPFNEWSDKEILNLFE